MNHFIKAIYFFVLLTPLHLSGASAAFSNNPDYIVHQRIFFTKKSDGFAGTLEIWRDKRLTDTDLNLMREHDPDNDPALSPRFKMTPLKSAMVVLTSDKPSGHQRIMQLLPLEKTYANIKEKIIDGAHKRIFLITEDFGIGFGSYNGPVTRLLEVNMHSMAWLRAFDRNSNKDIQVSLMRSLKSAWNFDPKSGDILQIRCRPNDSFDGFITYFSRYHHGDRGWTLITRSEPILWEAEDGDRELGISLPDLKKFPH